MVTCETSIEIQRHLDEFSLDVGLTYLDNELLARVRTLIAISARVSRAV